MWCAGPSLDMSRTSRFLLLPQKCSSPFLPVTPLRPRPQHDKACIHTILLYSHHTQVALRLFGVANHSSGVREPFHCCETPWPYTVLCLTHPTAVTTIQAQTSRDRFSQASGPGGALRRCSLEAMVRYQCLATQTARCIVDFPWWRMPGIRPLVRACP